MNQRVHDRVNRVPRPQWSTDLSPGRGQESVVHGLRHGVIPTQDRTGLRGLATGTVVDAPHSSTGTAGPGGRDGPGDGCRADSYRPWSATTRAAPQARQPPLSACLMVSAPTHGGAQTPNPAFSARAGPSVPAVVQPEPRSSPPAGNRPSARRGRVGLGPQPPVALGEPPEGLRELRTQTVR